jgi:hypothetical protein
MITRAKAGTLLLGLNEQGRSCRERFAPRLCVMIASFPRKEGISCGGIMRSLKARRMPPNVLPALNRGNNPSGAMRATALSRHAKELGKRTDSVRVRTHQKRLEICRPRQCQRMTTDFLFTLKFDEAGDWKTVKTHQMSKKELEGEQ